MKRNNRAAKRVRPLTYAISVSGALALCGTSLRQAHGDDAQSILTIDHYVTQLSEAPPIRGRHTQLYVRERARPATIARGGDLEGRVVLFVHGAGTPAEVAFDVPHADYSWMAYLAGAGFDVFAVDMTGYGRSTRPHVMNDPCNLSEEAQRELGIGVAHGSCPRSHVGVTTTIGSDWADVDRVVDHIRELRGVERVSLIGWSLGGPRAGGYAARHPDKVERLVLLAPAYTRDAPAEPADEPDERPAMSAQSRADFLGYWNGETACENQREPAVAEAIFSEMLASDPVGATWGPGIRRAPTVAVWGWNEQIAGGSTPPLLAIAAADDAAVAPERVRELYDDYGAEQKVLLDLGCAAHGAMWEANHLLLFEASLEWLRSGTVEGESSGVIRMGY